MSEQFQSHNGAIAAGSGGQGKAGGDEVFQSHNGAIAALPVSCMENGGGAFQSHNGAIAAQVVEIEYLPLHLVSIPQWCDCCRRDKDAFKRP